MANRNKLSEVEIIMLSLAQAISDMAGTRALGAAEAKPRDDETQRLRARVDALEATQQQLTRLLEQQNRILSAIASETAAAPAYSNVQVLPKR